MDSLSEKCIDRMIVSKPDGEGLMAFCDTRGRIRELTFMAIKIPDPPSFPVQEEHSPRNPDMADSIAGLTPHALRLFLNDTIQKLKSGESCAEVIRISIHLLRLFVRDSEKLGPFCNVIHSTVEAYNNNPAKNSVALKNLTRRINALNAAIAAMEEKCKLFIAFFEKIKANDFTPIEDNGETASKFS